MLAVRSNLTMEVTMKNPLESLGNTVILGVVLTVVMVVLIHVIQ